MDYTKNYHLPQWVEEDRIRRTDFNDAMVRIENGLTEGGADRIALHSALRGALMRQACNHWRQLAALPETPWQEGYFRQGFAEGESSDIGGMRQLEDRVWTAYGDKLQHSENLMLQKLSDISSELGVKTCAFTFTMPVNGCLEYILLKGYFESADGTAEGAIVLRIYNDETGELLEENATFIGDKTWKGLNKGSGYFRNDIGRFFQAETRYRIELQLNKLETPCSFTLGTTTSNPLVFSKTNQELVTLTRQLRTEGESVGGAVLAHYDAWGCTNPLSVSCLDETFTPYSVREVTCMGKNLKEAEFRINRTIPADCTLTLNIHCEKDGDLSLYDWGAVLI